ncbi:hypothetical protein BOTCAL_0392g00050 [Botryotinia calthae]|uniref:Uncharacterized protein n=1 Tax=Botryotinia calthae TaxID=38488 RepID=A0A4Y8CSK6_9HELO|nr:hypothetical protein BOTCAL_0392g00050 [Botryotinia calthae]
MAIFENSGVVICGGFRSQTVSQRNISQEQVLLASGSELQHIFWGGKGARGGGRLLEHHESLLRQGIAIRSHLENFSRATSFLPKNSPSNDYQGKFEQTTATEREIIYGDVDLGKNHWAVITKSLLSLEEGSISDDLRWPLGRVN